MDKEKPKQGKVGAPKQYLYGAERLLEVQRIFLHSFSKTGTKQRWGKELARVIVNE